MSQKEKMLQGKLYDSSDNELVQLRNKAHNLCIEYNQILNDDNEKKTLILNKLLPNRSKTSYFQGPIYFDYGIYTTIGENFFANFNLTILDCNEVKIGNNVMIGPNCALLTPIHPMLYQERNFINNQDGTTSTYEYAKAIIIEDNCWLAGNVIIIGGVRIGFGSVIGAGSVVTKDIPPNCFAAGNPCRVIRKLDENDSIKLKLNV